MKWSLPLAVVLLCLSCQKSTTEPTEPEDQYNLGMQYFNGAGVTQDYSQAVLLFRRAAAQNDPQAEASLGVCYARGSGVTQDYAEAVHWFHKAAAQGNLLAQLNLGLSYRDGHGVTQDCSEAVQWLRRSADRGLDLAQIDLGLCYYHGQCVSQDLVQAATYFQRAAKQENPDGELLLALCYAEGQGVTQNNVEAFAWLDLAAAGGQTKAKEIDDKVATSLTTQQLAEARARQSQILLETQISPALKNQSVTREFSSITSSTPTKVSTSLFYWSYRPGVQTEASKVITERWKVLVSLVICVIFIGCATRFLNVWLLDEQKQHLKQRFEDWWLNVECLDRQRFALSVAAGISTFLDSYFGARFFSAKSLWRSFCISTSLLLASLSLIGVFNGELAGISPSANYETPIKWVRINWDVLGDRLTNPTDSKEEQEQKVKQWRDLKDKILRFDTRGWRTLYATVFFTCLIIANSCLFPLSLAFSRVVLREMVAAGRTFTCFALFVTNASLLVVLSGVFLLILWTLALPAIWFAVALATVLLWQAKVLYLALLPIAIPVAWTFSPPALKSMVLIAFCPCSLTLLVTIFTMATLGFRRKLHTVLSSILLRCATKGPLVLIGAFVTLLVGLITLLSKWSTWSF
jgi:hypothetical protein